MTTSSRGDTPDDSTLQTREDPQSGPGPPSMADPFPRSPRCKPIAPPDSPYLLVSADRSSSLSSSQTQDLPQTSTTINKSRDSILQSRQRRISSSSRAARRGLIPIRTSRNRPRFWILLPLVALLDVLVEGVLALGVLDRIAQDGERTPHHGRQSGDGGGSHEGGGGGHHRDGRGHIDPDGSDGFQEKQKALVYTLLALAALRSIVIAVVGIGNKTDQLGLVIATVCVLSTLVIVSIFNLLFQSGQLFLPFLHHESLNPHLRWSLPFPPSLPLLNMISLAFTVLEYIIYILVVGIRVPPTGISRGRMDEMRRWKRGIREVGSAEGEGLHDFIVEPEGGDERSDAYEGQSTTFRGSRYSTDARRGSFTSAKGGSWVAPPARTPSTASSSNRNLLRSPISPLRARSYGATDLGEPLVLPEQLQQQHRSYPSTSPPTQGGHRGFEEANVLEAQLGSAQKPSSSPRSPEGLPNDSSESSREQVLDEATEQGELEGTETEEDLISEDEEAEEEEEEEDQLDPDEIIDIPPLPSSISRDASRFRLAMAMADEDTRRSSLQRSTSGSYASGGSTSASASASASTSSPGTILDEFAHRDSLEQHAHDLPSNNESVSTSSSSSNNNNNTTTETPKRRIDRAKFPSTTRGFLGLPSSTSLKSGSGGSGSGTGGRIDQKMIKGGRSQALFRSGSQRLKNVLSGGGGGGGGAAAAGERSGKGRFFGGSNNTTTTNSGAGGGGAGGAGGAGGSSASSGNGM